MNFVHILLLKKAVWDRDGHELCRMDGCWHSDCVVHIPVRMALASTQFQKFFQVISNTLLYFSQVEKPITSLFFTFVDFRTGQLEMRNNATCVTRKN